MADAGGSAGAADSASAAPDPRRRPRGGPTTAGVSHQSGPSAAHASPPSSGTAPIARGSRFSYQPGKVLGHGSFGIVTQAVCIETGEVVAIKKVLQDPRYKNRELDILKAVRHRNLIALRDYFYSDDVDERNAKEGSKNLNVVMEFIPETVYRVVKMSIKNSAALHPLVIKLYAYQMCRALGCLHLHGICHRDIKPQNLLVDPETHVLKVCDFGSAKKLVEGESSVAYICSRYYRAPELMLGATEYTTRIDVWSIGCVLSEMILGRPLFPGESPVDQLVKIIQTLGTPTRAQMHAMNPNYTEFRFPDVQPRVWADIFPRSTPPELVDLLRQLLRYEPQARLELYQALGHPFFAELRLPDICLPNGRPLPPLFDFTSAELAVLPEDLRAHARSRGAAQPGAINSAGAGSSPADTNSASRTNAPSSPCPQIRSSRDTQGKSDTLPSIPKCNHDSRQPTSFPDPVATAQQRAPPTTIT